MSERVRGDLVGESSVIDGRLPHSGSYFRVVERSATLAGEHECVRFGADVVSEMFGQQFHKKRCNGTERFRSGSIGPDSTPPFKSAIDSLMISREGKR